MRLGPVFRAARGFASSATRFLSYSMCVMRVSFAGGYRVVWWADYLSRPVWCGDWERDRAETRVQRPARRDCADCAAAARCRLRVHLVLLYALAACTWNMPCVRPSRAKFVIYEYYLRRRSHLLYLCEQSGQNKAEASGNSLTWQDFPMRKPSFERCRAHLAAASRVSRVSARGLVRYIL